MKFTYQVVITVPDKFLMPSPGSHPDNTPDRIETAMGRGLDLAIDVAKFLPIGSWWKVRPLARRGRPAPKVSA